MKCAFHSKMKRVKITTRQNLQLKFNSFSKANRCRRGKKLKMVLYTSLLNNKNMKTTIYIFLSIVLALAIQKPAKAQEPEFDFSFSLVLPSNVDNLSTSELSKLESKM